ncbi:uncharacterized protein LOC113309953 [Papaver somniferum]|uniref:uncharacterized protein LOC113309953 n=1 Tax=Papaver somniferum TaxID=3469 RepID=UPI000E6FD27D|nr:uncharacterized protein LOC113309953 [Papaver somniferum]XP_026414258.1 uncharacterized protein LOC113309953 [Papaver somniferum]XP_026414259.1 uncharacterized protein LOC113309953 [Papaver somniferum]XP_026414260.1 uncharacterized protein LOC113309953 [Papaver somniferum]XP_026414261.1 uncharacterized protein LOC113309953 [Papaver somniferum]XP_026414262.1 uncharacterized protein LOC113309953 [Papaver somniferum]XP_026414263.1 uncharacterized protein LOC113309953 [Papaver somniferum]
MIQHTTMPPNWDFGDCFLLNPATLETIRLPSLLPLYHKRNEYSLIDCVLSSPPRTSTSTIAYPDNADDEPLVLLLFLLRGRDDSDGHMFLAFSHPEDKQWKTKWVLSQDSRTDEFLITSLCCFKDKLYLMCALDQHLEIDKGKLWDNDDDSLTLKPFEMTNNTGYRWRGSDHIDSRDFYVESSVELFKVEINFNRRQRIKVFNSVVVWRLDFTSKESKMVTCLGDHVLFIGKNTRACCSASKLGLTSGCLYYTLPGDLGLYKFEVQSSGNSVILPCLKLPRPWFSSDWIMILDGRKQEEEEGDSMGKAVESESSIMGYEKNESGKDGGFEEISPWDILNAVILPFLSCFPSDWIKILDGRQHEEEKEDCMRVAVENGLSIITYEKNENEKEGGFEETSPWDILDADSRELVASYLHPLDYVHFRSVCKTIRALMPVSKPMFATTSITTTSNLFPWLVFCGDNNDTIYNFVIPVRNSEYYLLKFSELLLGATICFQKDGWLLMSRKEILFFYNPFTRETINLPHLPGHHFSSSICFCPLPTSADCIVFAIDQSEQGTITVCSITRGKQVWDVFNFDNAIQYRPLCNPPILHQGAFYCVDYNGLLGAFNWKDKTWKLHGIPRERYNDTYPNPSFLVKSGEDLLLVRVGCEEKLVIVLKFDFPVNDWVEVASLGKHMLFISHTSCFLAIAPNSQMENKIFLPRLCLNGDGILFYSLETGRYDSFGGPHTSMNLYETEGWRANCTWIEPNWSKFTSRELIWVEPTF